jgi:uncharacterized membrane protein
MGITIIISLLILVLAFIFASPMGAIMVSIANWINYKAGNSHVYSVKGGPKIEFEFNRPRNDV